MGMAPELGGGIYSLTVSSRSPAILQFLFQPLELLPELINFLQQLALRRSGLSSLASEQRIRYSTRQGMKGVEVDRIELI